MLETRVRVINSRMVDIDRSDKNVILQDERIIPYDTLVLAMGLQDKTLQNLKKQVENDREVSYVSRSVIMPAEDERFRRVEGVFSIDDPYIYHDLRVGGTLMDGLTNRRKPKNCVIYGLSLHSYICIRGLLSRGVKPE